MSLELLAKREKMPGCDLVCQYEAGIPVYRARLKVNLQMQQPLPAISQFVLQLINLGVNTQSEVEQALGLEAEFIRSALVQLDVSQLITYSTDRRPSAFAVTENGKQALHEVMAAFVAERFELQVDGLTGKLVALDLNSLWRSEDLRKRGVWLLHAPPGARPTLENLNRNLDALTPICTEQLQLSEKDKLIEVLDIERSWLMYKLVNILVFRDRTTEQIYLHVYEGLVNVPEYDKILTRREQNGGRVIPEDMLVPSLEVAAPSKIARGLGPVIEKLEKVQQQIEEVEIQKEKLEASVDNTAGNADPITGKTKQILELEDQIVKLKAMLNRDRPVKGAEHRDLLKQALILAKSQVIIISPWVNQSATDNEIIGLIQDALRRGVSVLIGYGMPLRPGEKKEKYIDEVVEKKLKKIQRGSNGDKLRLEWLGNTHEKILVCDRRFCVLTSFNFLSYRGDQGFRREKGAYFENPEMIKQVADDVLKLF